MFKLTKNCSKLITIFKYTSNNSTVNNVFTNGRQPIQHQFPLRSQRFYSSSNDVLSLDDAEINELAEGNEEQIHKLKVLLLEAEVMRQEGKPVPSPATMTMEQWKELLTRPSRSARRKYLEFLFKLEKKKENRVAKKEQKRLDMEERPPLDLEAPFRYHLGHNNMFLRFYDSTINHFYNSRLINAMQFSQRIVIDCGYHEHMSKREIINCAKQLTIVFADNRAHDDPFDIHYCNLLPKGMLEHYMHKTIPTMFDETFPMNLHECSYMDLFPKEKLVYLTPHCREELHDFDHDAVYIVGAIVDKINNEPVSMAKAKREGLRMAKLPLDKYLTWGSGSGKSLAINQVTSIMLDIRFKNDWNYALRHVPRRKLINEYDQPPLEDVDIVQHSVSNRLIKKSKSATSWRPSAARKEIEFNDDEDVIPNDSNKRGNSNRSNRSNNASKERLVHLKNILKE